MFTRTLTAALVSGILLTGFAQTQAVAFEGGGGGGGEPPMATTHNPDGSLITSRGNRDGSRTITERDRNGKVVRQHRAGGKKKPGKKPKKAKGRPWASSFDPATGQRVTSIGNDNGTRTVITFGPFGLSIGISR